MGKIWVVLIAAVLLTGCTGPEVYETMEDSVQVQAPAEKMEILFSLPSDASQQVMSGEENGDVYFCKDYVLTVQTVDGGDLKKTFLNATGFAPEQLSVMQTKQGEAIRYSCVWTAAGESGDQVGRCAILDDGNYHYVLTAMADAELAGELTDGAWRGIFNSFRLVEPEDVVNSGS